jgi:16S rRNA (guanine527-N7)-methyltransferase
MTPDEYIQQFKILLLQENERQNLVSRKSAATEFDKHVADSLALLRFRGLAGERLIDIGSGAGFPGLLLAMAEPQLRLTLLESDLKKSRFLEETAAALGLSNVTVLRLRAEEAGRKPELREQFTLATGRAVAKINVMAEYALPFLRVGGELWLWKGPGYQEELSAAATALQRLYAAATVNHHYAALDGAARVLTVIEKQKPTPAIYPRAIGVPGKKPL